MNLPLILADVGDFEAHQVADLEHAVASQHLIDGVTHIRTTTNGVRISAKIEGGKITDWIAAGSDGQPVPLYPFKKTIRCWRCYRARDGNIDCFSIPCPDGFGGSRV